MSQSIRTGAKFFLCLALLLVSSVASAAPQFLESKPMDRLVTIPVGNWQPTEYVRLPIITWGGDIATIYANGNDKRTRADSVFGQAGLKFELFREDDFVKQVEAYVSGKTPYLRGTMGMINQALAVINADPRTRPVAFYQMTWSTGGDAMVVKPGITSAKDLRGKTIAVQAYGPHVDYLLKLLADAGLTSRDVKIVWLKDLTGTANTPGKAFALPNVDAAMVIIPDALALTSNGTVGTGAEGSVRGARILLSTKTANRVIADVYVVRSDYFAAHRGEVEAFTRGLLQGQEKLEALFKAKATRGSEFKPMIQAAAEILLDSRQATADAEGLYNDCTYVGLAGNKQFFTDTQYPRNFANITKELQAVFRGFGLLSTAIPLNQANWDYVALSGSAAKVVATEAPSFDQAAVARVVSKRQAQGILGQGELFSTEIYFAPNQTAFPVASYAEAFARVVELSTSYGGAVLTIEGHSDPMEYLRAKKAGKPEVELRRIVQAGRNLSLSRGNAVRDSLMAFAREKGVTLDASQFTVIGHGFDNPKSGMCGVDPCPPTTEQAWRDNMRVVFRIIQVEAEATVFRPL